MCIIIETELFIQKKEKYRKIKNVSALPIDKLPWKYITGNGHPAMFFTKEFDDVPKLKIYENGKFSGSLIKDFIYPEEEFQRLMLLIQKAGEALMKINDFEKNYKEKPGFQAYYI